MSHKKIGMSMRQVHWPRGLAAAAFFGLAALLAFSGCAGNQTKYELPFGSHMDVDALEASIVLTGEGEFVVNIVNNAPEPLNVDVRVGRTEIGYNYNSSSSKADKGYYSKWKVDYSPVTLAESESRDFIVTLTNPYQVTKTFHSNISIHVKGVKARWRFDSAVYDDDLFTDSKFLRSLNTTAYWHPKQYDENWREYEAHIAK